MIGRWALTDSLKGLQTYIKFNHVQIVTYYIIVRVSFTGAGWGHAGGIRYICTAINTDRVFKNGYRVTYIYINSCNRFYIALLTQ